MRILLLLAASPLLATFAPASLFSKPEPPASTRLSFEAVRLDETNPARRAVGRLQYLGGWVVRSNDRRFGGISAMHVEAATVTAVSDAGTVIRFGLPGTRPQSGDIFPLPQGPGSSGVKEDRDAESMAVHKRKVWVTFEGRDEVWRYARASWKPESHAAPPDMKKWPFNGGGEAMLRLNDGRFLIFKEGGEGNGGTTEVLLFDSDPAVPASRVTRLWYRPPNGYKITDAALLPDGRMLYLNRRFAFTEGMSAKLTMGPKPVLKPDAILSGAEIARLEPPLTVDNMEALSITQENGRSILWIASDDNFVPLQRTLLLKFALAE